MSAAILRHVGSHVRTRAHPWDASSPWVVRWRCMTDNRSAGERRTPAATPCIVRRQTSARKECQTPTPMRPGVLPERGTIVTMEKHAITCARAVLGDPTELTGIAFSCDRMRTIVARAALHGTNRMRPPLERGFARAGVPTARSRRRRSAFGRQEARRHDPRPAASGRRGRRTDESGGFRGSSDGRRDMNVSHAMQSSADRDAVGCKRPPGACAKEKDEMIGLPVERAAMSADVPSQCAPCIREGSVLLSRKGKRTQRASGQLCSLGPSPWAYSHPPLRV